MASQPLKYTVTHYHNPNKTTEEFLQWIRESHLPRALPLFKRYGALRYTLFVTPAPLNQAVKAAVGPLRPGWEFADYDCIIEYVVKDIQSINEAMADPEWLEITKDQADWVDMSRALVTIGTETPYLLETGEIVNLPK